MFLKVNSLEFLYYDNLGLLLLNIVLFDVFFLFNCLVCQFFEEVVFFDLGNINLIFVRFQVFKE